MFQTFGDSEPEYLAGCESVTYEWSSDETPRGWTRTDPSKQPGVDAPDAIPFEVILDAASRRDDGRRGRRDAGWHRQPTSNPPHRCRRARDGSGLLRGAE